MAKACAYLCRQRCFIDGFGEFGEIFGHCFEPTLGGGLRQRTMFILGSLESA